MYLHISVAFRCTSSQTTAWCKAPRQWKSQCFKAPADRFACLFLVCVLVSRFTSQLSWKTGMSGKHGGEWPWLLLRIFNLILSLIFYLSVELSADWLLLSAQMKTDGKQKMLLFIAVCLHGASNVSSFLSQKKLFLVKLESQWKRVEHQRVHTDFH